MPLADLFRKAGQSVYRATVPVNARMLLDTMGGNRAPITEKDFSPEELQVLVDALHNRKDFNTVMEQDYRNNAAKTAAVYAARPETELRWTSPDTATGQPMSYQKYQQQQQAAAASYGKNRAKTSVSYNDYPDRMGAPLFDNTLGSVLKSYTDPNYRMKTTLGSFNAYDTPQGTQIRDRYNFDNNDFYRAIEGIDPDKTSFADLFHKANGPVELFDMYMASRYPGASRDVNIMLPPPGSRPAPVALPPPGPNP